MPRVCLVGCDPESREVSDLCLGYAWIGKSSSAVMFAMNLEATPSSGAKARLTHVGSIAEELIGFAKSDVMAHRCAKVATRPHYFALSVDW